METQSKVLKWALIIGIIIVINMFFNYTLSLVYKNPKYEAFCPTQQVNESVDTQQACLDKGGQWNANNQVPGPKGVSTVVNGVVVPAGYCNLQYTCQNNYNDAQKVYDRNVFITLVILGALCVALGSFLKSNILIGIALSLAGVLSFIIASMRYWTSADDLIKVIILAIALGILFWVAVKKFKSN
ncbi:MAG: hypothetical protein WCP17_03080 [bacterium]